MTTSAIQQALPNRHDSRLNHALDDIHSFDHLFITGAQALTVRRYVPALQRYDGVLNDRDVYSVLDAGGPLDAREMVPAGSHIAGMRPRDRFARVALRRHQS